MATECQKCHRELAADYASWLRSDTTCGINPEWNAYGESHEDCINECLYAQTQWQERRIAELDGRRREGRQLLRRLVKYIREDGSVGVFTARLGCLTEQVDSYLSRTGEPGDILRQSDDQ